MLFPQSISVQISILIPTYNRSELLKHCLLPLSLSTQTNCEVIVIDNASTDQTPELLAQIENVTVISSEVNLDFLRANNLGARLAKGEYLLFLNNDAEMAETCLSSLLDALERSSDCGAVGAKLVFPSGRLQEAGAIVWNDGTTFGYGRGDDVSKPEYNYIREVDYCSAACLLVRRDLFEQLGGFDERYAPAYCEDVDLCFGIRSLGYKVLYQPQAVVIHHEGASRTTERRLELVDINRRKFLEKWGDRLKNKQPPLPGEKPIEFRARNLRVGRRVLFISDHLLIEDDHSEDRHLIALIDELVRINTVLTIALLQDVIGNHNYIGTLQARGVEVLYPQPNTHNGIGFAKSILFDRKGCYDTIIVSNVDDILELLAPVNESQPQSLILYDAESSSDESIDETTLIDSRIDGVLVASEQSYEKICRTLSKDKVKFWAVANGTDKTNTNLSSLLSADAWSFVLRARVAERNAEANRQAREELEEIHRSKSWQLLVIYRQVRNTIFGFVYSLIAKGDNANSKT